MYREFGTFRTLDDLIEILIKLKEDGKGSYGVGSYPDEDSVTVEISELDKIILL